MRHLKRVASFVITLLLCVESLLCNGASTAMALALDEALSSGAAAQAAVVRASPQARRVHAT